MDADRLLAEIAPLSPSARTTRVIAVARDLRDTAPAQWEAVLAELSGGDLYARRLAAVMAATSGHRQQLARAVGDEAPAVAVLALTAGELPDELAREVLTSGPLALRRLVAHRLRRERREVLAAACLPVVRERWGDRDAARLLAACDPDTVHRELPDLAYAVANWTTLAARHPQVVADRAHADLASLTGPAVPWWWLHQRALITALVPVRPETVLDLAEQHLTGKLPPVLVQALPTLLRVDPRRVVKFLLAAPDRASALARRTLSRATRTRLTEVSDADLAALLRATDRDPSLTRQVLGAIAPSRRPAVLAATFEGVAADTLRLDEDLLALLPWRHRQAEARRQLALPQVKQDREQTWTITAYLPVAEAVPVLEEITRSADTEHRATGYRLLLRNAALGGDPERVTHLLTWLARMRNERDPVRQTVLAAVADLPYDLITAAAIPALDRLISEALDARDTSWSSTRAAAQLAFRVLWLSGGRDDAEAADLSRWALTTVERLGAWQSHAVVPGVDLVRVLRRGQEQRLWEHLREPARQALRRNQAWPVLHLARQLGRRAWNLPELQDLLADAMGIRNDAVLRDAATLWLACPATRAERAAWAVDADPSTVTIPAVLDVLVNIRTDLLERQVLSGRRLRGQLAPRGIWVPLIGRGRQLRWTPGQQSQYRRLLGRGARDAKATRWDQAQYARLLAAAPGATSAELVDLLTGDDVLVTEAVLTGLGDSDHPEQALRLLLTHLDDDRARVATYALSRCARSLPPSSLIGLFTGLLREAPKVVVRKEAARLIADHHLADALDVLVATGQPALADRAVHRDVRIAALTGLTAFPGDAAIWPALTAAATDPDPDVAAALLATRWTALPPSARERYADLVCVVAEHPDGPTAYRALTTVATWFPWARHGGRVIRRSLLDLDRQDTWRAATITAADPAVWTVDPTLPADLAAALIDRLDAGPDAGPTRDLPARRRLDQLVSGFAARPDDLRAHPAAAQGLAEVLARAGLPAGAARLHVVLGSPGPSAARHLFRAAELLAERPVTAASLAEDLAPGPWATEATAALIGNLLHRGDGPAGRFALALTLAAGQASNWSRPWVDQLRALRRHPDLDVRDAAFAVVTAPE